jgi:catechol 2,3-dioxygenase-like lactoylglutathione lyase family enzyme
MTANSVGQVMVPVVAGANTFPDIVHVALTVTDLDRSVPWYGALFGAAADHVHDGQPIRAAVWTLPSVAVALHEFVHQAREESFDELRPGLDHLAFRCADRGELEAWAIRLDALGVTHSDIVDAPDGSGLSFRDPDNIALEFFALPPSPGDLSEGRNQ